MTRASSTSPSATPSASPRLGLWPRSARPATPTTTPWPRPSTLYKAELIRNHGPWRSIDELEIATAEYIDWFNHRRLHGEIGMIPPVEFEDIYHHHQTVPATADAALASH
ncbi:IS3 family transposase [Brachybacterium paraconglomeratum]|uniref:IS3 family transposase n=1 Tax=Brachybacterium paraconglomeratum TaxID=173362 RepID=UPI0022DFD69F|nr:IS3 family transposase [Brachybacterium paraconglomeratum]